MIEVRESSHRTGRLLPLMKTVDNWICWAYSHNDDFIPLNVNSFDPFRDRFRAADYQNKSIHMEYEKASELVNSYSQIDGLGFVFKGTNVTMIDIDDCMKNGKVNEEIFNILTDVDSYTEISDSGTGIHIYCHGQIPTYGSTPDDYDNKISIFDKSWAVVTHRHLKGFPTIVESNPGKLKRLCREYDINPN